MFWWLTRHIRSAKAIGQIPARDVTSCSNVDKLKHMYCHKLSVTNIPLSYRNCINPKTTSIMHRYQTMGLKVRWKIKQILEALWSSLFNSFLCYHQCSAHQYICMVRFNMNYEWWQCNSLAVYTPHVHWKMTQQRLQYDTEWLAKRNLWVKYHVWCKKINVTKKTRTKLYEHLH